MGANMMLTLGAILLFGMFLSSSNKLMTGNSQIASQNEYYITALGIAQSVLDEAKMKAFDHRTRFAAVKLTSSLTRKDSLGIADTLTEKFTLPDTFSTAGFLSTRRFNDIDDYNLYSRIVNTPRAEGYKISVKVNYANETNPDVAAVSQTFCKKMTISVTSPFFPTKQEGGGTVTPDTLRLSYAFTY